MTRKPLTADSTMAEVLEAYPGAQRAMMRKYHIGGCSSCGFTPHDKLGDVLARHDSPDVDEVVAHIADSEAQEALIQIDATELAASLAGDAPPKLIDVRDQGEFDLVHLEGARLATQEVVDEMMTTWPKDTPIVAYCHHGIRSLQASAYFIGHGFTNVRSLRGGVDTWACDVDPSLPRY